MEQRHGERALRSSTRLRIGSAEIQEFHPDSDETSGLFGSRSERSLVDAGCGSCRGQVKQRLKPEGILGAAGLEHRACALQRSSGSPTRAADVHQPPERSAASSRALGRELRPL